MSSKLEKGALGKRVAQFLDSHVEILRDPSDMQPPHVTVAEIKQAIRDSAPQIGRGNRQEVKAAIESWFSSKGISLQEQIRTSTGEKLNSVFSGARLSDKLVSAAAVTGEVELLLETRTGQEALAKSGMAFIKTALARLQALCRGFQVRRKYATQDAELEKADTPDALIDEKVAQHKVALHKVARALRVWSRLWRTSSKTVERQAFGNQLPPLREGIDINAAGMDTEAEGPDSLLIPKPDEATEPAATPSWYVKSAGIGDKPPPSTIKRTSGDGTYRRTFEVPTEIPGMTQHAGGEWYDHNNQKVLSPELLGPGTSLVWPQDGKDSPFSLRVLTRFGRLSIESPESQESPTDIKTPDAADAIRQANQALLIADHKFVRSLFTEAEVAPMSMKKFFGSAYDVAVKQWGINPNCPFSNIVLETILRWRPDLSMPVASPTSFETPAPKADKSKTAKA